MTRDQQVHFWRDMLRARRFDERIVQEYAKGNVGGFYICIPVRKRWPLAFSTIHELTRGTPMRAD